jgi:ribosomal protein L40E
VFHLFVFAQSFWIIAVIVVIVLVATASSRRRRLMDRGRFGVGVCEHCGTSQPAHAAYCRKCGRRL